jgi:hypothetical protein
MFIQKSFSIRIATMINAAIAIYEDGFAKFRVHPREGCNLGTISLGSRRLK